MIDRFPCEEAAKRLHHANTTAEKGLTNQERAAHFLLISLAFAMAAITSLITYAILD